MALDNIDIFGGIIFGASVCWVASRSYSKYINEKIETNQSILESTIKNEKIPEMYQFNLETYKKLLKLNNPKIGIILNPFQYSYYNKEISELKNSAKERLKNLQERL